MRMFKKMAIVLSILTSLSLVMTACGTSKSTNVNDKNGESTTSAEKNENTEKNEETEKIDFTVMIQNADDKMSGEIVKKIQEKFPNLNVISKQWDTANAEKAIKTSIASGNPIDLAMYWPTQMQTFVSSNMALDLTSYLEENNGSWKDSFADGAIGMGTYNEKVFAVPFTSVYPMIEANKDIFDKAGVAIPDGSWTWDEFIKACNTIKEKTGVYPVGLSKDWAAWVPRNGLITAWSDKTKMEDFAAGKISLTDPTVTTVFDATKELYDNYVYPGKGAISATLDQINIAFKQGEIAMKFNVNIMAAQSIKNSGLKNVKIASFPIMGSLDYVLGGSNGYMIPANAQHPEESIEVLKYITSPEVNQLYVDAGTPVVIKGVKTNDPNFALYSKDATKVYPTEILQLSSQLSDYLNVKMPANYLFNGKASLEDVEKLRLEAIKEK